MSTTTRPRPSPTAPRCRASTITSRRRPTASRNPLPINDATLFFAPSSLNCTSTSARTSSTTTSWVTVQAALYEPRVPLRLTRSIQPLLPRPGMTPARSTQPPLRRTMAAGKKREQARFSPPLAMTLLCPANIDCVPSPLPIMMQNRCISSFPSDSQTVTSVTAQGRREMLCMVYR